MNIKNNTIMITQNKRLTAMVLTEAYQLLIPLIAMKFTNEVSWTLFDFVIAAVLLFGTGFLCELILRKVKKTGYRIALCAALLVGLLLIWLELAVGIFGTPLAGS